MRLVSFAVHWIRAEIHEYVLRNWRLVKVATTKAQRKLFFNLRRMKKNLSWLTHEETAAVAKDLGVTHGRSHRDGAAAVGARHVVRSDSGGDDEDELYSPASYLPAPDADPAEQVEEAESGDDSSTRLRGALSGLDERSRDILAAPLDGEDKATLHELADKYGVSAERIRQIEASALGKLRGLMVAA